MFKIDLRNLTQAHLDECLPNIDSASCDYAAPCIIGTLIPRLDRAAANQIIGPISLVSRTALFCMPEDQIDAAFMLQNAFDGGDKDEVLRLAKPWIEATPETPQ